MPSSRRAFISFSLVKIFIKESVVVFPLQFSRKRLHHPLTKPMLHPAAFLSGVHLELSKVAVVAICQHPNLYPPFDGLHGIVLLQGRSALKLYHGLVDRYLAVWLVQVCEFGRQVIDHWPHFPQPIVTWRFARLQTVVVHEVQIARHFTKAVTCDPACDWSIV